MRNAALAVILLFALAAPASAQTGPGPSASAQPPSAKPPPVATLTLAQALERARTAAFDVRIAQADAAVAAADAASSRAMLRPRIALSANALEANEPQLGMPVARQAYAAASISVPLFTPSSALAARAADLTALAARTTVSGVVNDAVFSAAQAYRRVQLADAVLLARNAAVTDQENHLRVTEQRVAAGKTARYLLARDRAALASAQQAQEDAASERDRAANDLSAMLGLALESMGVEPLARDAFSDTRDAALSRALGRRPALVAAEQRVSASLAGVAAARGALRPSATFTAQSYNGSSSPALGRSGGQVEVTASLPIADGGSRAAASAKARAEYERAVAARDQIRAGVVRDVANAWREFEAASRNIATATSALGDAQEQLRIATLRESIGKGTAAEVLDAVSMAASARETIARSIARYDVAIAAIHHAAGDITP
ncbi:MAG: outer membrane protein [Candidatus Eremiobacteraeota bacterium]|nr:outer membrane protein [Candidatus Eremiobacteraeota bacterium]